MKRLILMRHAKSDWSTSGAEDHARSLNKRGRKSAAALGDWLRARRIIPDQVLCSTAKRTRETLELLDLNAPAVFEDRLYHAGPATLFDSLHAATGDTVLMVGHNPGFADFANVLVAQAPDHPRFRDYPTGATLVAEFDLEDWAVAQPGTGRATAFVVPRDLI